MFHLHRAPSSPDSIRDIHKAAVVAAGDGVGTRAEDRVELVVCHGHGDFRQLHHEDPSEAAAPVRIGQGHELRALQRLKEEQWFLPDPELSRELTRRMVCDPAICRQADFVGFEHMNKKLTELIGPGGNGLRLFSHPVVVLEQLGIVVLHHGRT